MPKIQAHTKTTTSIQKAKDVLSLEAEALSRLAQTLDEQFEQAIDQIETMKNSRLGRLIVAGIGKSGHIARKVAATLASTGTPAFFVHPGEASHGDLGMITHHDVVIIFSNSGENTELSDLIFYTRRYSIPLICVTSNRQSTLYKHSDFGLVMPDVPEACPNGLAPTTSTTMMLALGDALAIALLDRMALSSEQYKVFHPGGKLGKKLMKIEEIMRKDHELPIITPDTKMDQALLIMTEKNLGSLLILDDRHHLIGIITDGDLKRHMDRDLLTRSASEIMSTSPKTISSQALAAEAIDIMTNRYDQSISSLVVINEDNTVTGLIRIQDCIQAGIV